MYQATFFNAADHFVRSLRNRNKKCYAIRYASWLMEGSDATTEPKAEGLTAMGAQSVRMTLDRLWRESVCPEDSW